MPGGDGDLGGAVPGQEAGEEADGPGAQHQHPALDLQAAQGDAPVGASHRLYKGCEERGEGVGNGVDGVGGDIDKLGETAGLIDTDKLHVWADVGGASRAVVAIQTGVQGLDGV